MRSQGYVRRRWPDAYVSGFEGELELVPKGESEPFAGVERGEYEREDLYQLDRRVELIITR